MFFNFICWFYFIYLFYFISLSFCLFGLIYFCLLFLFRGLSGGSSSNVASALAPSKGRTASPSMHRVEGRRADEAAPELKAFTGERGADRKCRQCPST